MMESETIKALADLGIGAVAVFVVAYLFLKFIQLYKETTQQHKAERDEWRTVIKEGQDQTKAVLDDLASVIRGINK